VGANCSSTRTSFPAVTAPAAIGSGTCARPTPSTAAPSIVGKSLAMRGPDTAISMARPLSLSDHVGGDELAQTDAGVKPVGREVDQFLACGDLHLDLGIGLAEGCDQRLQQDRHHRARHGEAQQPGRPLSEFTRDLACGDELLEGGLCSRKESFAGFGQADTARRADEEHCTDARLKCAYRL